MKDKLIKKVTRLKDLELKVAWRELDKSLPIDNITFKVLIFLQTAKRVYDLDLRVESVVSLYLQEDSGYRDVIDDIADCRIISGLPIPLYSVLDSMKKSIDDGEKEGMWGAWFN